MKIQAPLLQQTAEELERFFGPDGDIVQKYGGKSRWSQVEMALTLNRAFHESRSMLLEAPTGTGKTLAYLIPAALCMRSHPKQRFVISVATKNLQSQIERDLERFAAEFPEFKESAVLKGAGNYLCLNRLRRAANRPHYNRRVEDEIKLLFAGFESLERMPHGWREELSFKVSDQTWSAINGEGTCCRTICGCYHRQAKKLAAKARLVVVTAANEMAHAQEQIVKDLGGLPKPEELFEYLDADNKFFSDLEASRQSDPFYNPRDDKIAVPPQPNEPAAPAGPTSNWEEELSKNLQKVGKGAEKAVTPTPLKRVMANLTDVPDGIKAEE